MVSVLLPSTQPGMPVQTLFLNFAHYMEDVIECEEFNLD